MKQPNHLPQSILNLKQNFNFLSCEGLVENCMQNETATPIGFQLTYNCVPANLYKRLFLENCYNFIQTFINF